MPAWPGGPCPLCGEYMPKNLIHCQRCRALLNEDLDKSSVEIPAFIPLQEIDSMAQIQPAGYHVLCPHCQRELRINRKYVSQQVQCKLCHGKFLFDLENPEVRSPAFYATCPHCQKELRVAHKYLGMKVACKHCGGKLHLVAESN
ncbi:MAG: hypothetical protein GXP27_01865 [Planctomycetes bacterium]|nr:hypothetical protein [Planctomycetota bacterium]